VRALRVGKEERSMSAENEALVRRYVQEVYDQRKLEVVDEIFAPNVSLDDELSQPHKSDSRRHLAAGRWQDRRSVASL
jgi:hypothetical protein